MDLETNDLEIPSWITWTRRLVNGPGSEKMRVATLRTLPPSGSIYIWTSLSLLSLESGGQATYVEPLTLCSPIDPGSQLE